MSAKGKPNEIYISRIYDAPVKLVWDAWTDPKKVAKWWGPRGFTLTTHSKDLRAGGHWSYTMHGPDGTDFPNTTKYLEVEKYSRLVYDHGGHEDRPPLFRVTVTFEEVRGKTKMEMAMALATPEIAAETKKFIKKAGGNATWDRLAEYLSEEIHAKDAFVINRSFEAPLATVFRMWSDPDHLARWLPPTGFAMKFIRADLRTGGTTFFSMSNDSGMTMYGRMHYLEISAPERIAYTQEFCDANESPSRHPMAPTWPAVTQTTVVFTAEGPSSTRVTLTTEVVGTATAEERATFHAEKGGMTAGWTGSLDQLESLLGSS